MILPPPQGEGQGRNFFQLVPSLQGGVGEGALSSGAQSAYWRARLPFYRPAMSFASLEPALRRTLIAIWLAGGAALAATMVFSVAFSTPYHTFWAWISFIAMVAVEDVVRRRGPGWGWQLPAVTLVAATIA